MEVSGIGPAEQQPNELRWDAPGGPRTQIAIKYRHGYPLQVIAALQSIDVDRLVAELMAINPKEELRRAGWVRQRSLGAGEAIWKNHDLMYRLLDAGVGLSDTPKVLKALGIPIDADVAGELVHIPGIPSDRTEPEPLFRSIGDRLSLLYIAGKHHGIEPDYQLSLAQMPAEEIVGLRALFGPGLAPRRLAEALAVAEITKSAIRAGDVTTLSIADYRATAEAIAQQWHTFTIDAADPWPVPANTLRRRYAHGFWDEALKEVGLKVSSPSRFTEDEFFEALDDFHEECIGFKHPMTVYIYDRWVFAEASVRNDRPSALEVIRHYGDWPAVVEAMLQRGDQPESGPAREVPYVDYDSGWGTLEELADWENQQDNDWRTAEKLIGELINAMPVDSFLHIHYGQFGQAHAIPYARATLEREGVRCDIVSADGLSPRQWPLSPDYLSTNGWLAPNTDVPSWNKAGVPGKDAAAQILNGLRFGRHPVEATELRWTVGRVPDGPGPAGGVTLSAALHGTVQSLGNAAQP